MAKYLIVDPTPDGWKYGFPKRLPTTVSAGQIADWILSNGYPEKYKDIFRYRIWVEEIEDTPSYS